MGVVDDPVENGVGDCRLADHGMPLGDGQLRGDQRGFPAIAFLEDFQQIETLLVGQAVGAPVVKDEQLHPSQVVDETGKAAVERRRNYFAENHRQRPRFPAK